MAKKFYAVLKGHKVGIFTTWAACQASTKGYSGAAFKSFTTKEEADEYLGNTSTLPGTSPPKSTQGTAVANTPEGLTVVLAYQFPIQIYTDGACDPNPGATGSGLVVYEYGKLTTLKYGYHSPKGTNNTAELIALREAIKLAHYYIEKGQPVEILSDSDYSLKAVFVWSEGWEKKNWTKGGSAPIQNLELIKECYALSRPLIGKVQMTHVRAHLGTEGNELADRLSVQAQLQQVTGWADYTDEISPQKILALSRG
ncbi:ribonuclease H family protein [Paraglaciecola sp. MB-3u-78]|uniref:ribonuclease H family protein n=1 Tax=Paraglaciecola sp. MB-3u-78 TaxID=2058332 RepID=UPI000C3225E4|nr:ribonuclease H family protein [Paraglaciecola sp. MB-3u-78]PKG96188.1 ribonuclease HI [Paraglaciecola sp. MB-3u-78]